MKTISLSLVMLLAFVFSSVVATEAMAADTDPATSSDFATILSGALGLEMPEGTEGLSDAELFEIQVNMLAENGITNLIGMQPDDLISCGMLAEILYNALFGAEGNETTEDKLKYLIAEGYLPDYKIGDSMTIAEVISSLNIPALSDAIVEAYSGPGGRGRNMPGTTGNPAPITNSQPTAPGPESPLSPVAS